MRVSATTFLGIALGVAGTLCGPSANVRAAGQTYETPGSTERRQQGAAEAQREREQRAADMQRRLTELEADVRADREALDAKARQQEQALDAKARQQKAGLDLKAAEDKAKAATDEERSAIDARVTSEKAQLDANLGQQRRELEAKTREERAQLEARLQEGQRELKSKMEGVGPQAGQPSAAETRSEPGAPRIAVPGQPARPQMSGTVASINADAGLLSIKEDAPAAQPMGSAGFPTQLLLERDVNVMQGDRNIGLRDIRVGDRVTVQFEAAGSRTVRMITVHEGVPRS